MRLQWLNMVQPRLRVPPPNNNGRRSVWPIILLVSLVLISHYAHHKDHDEMHLSDASLNVLMIQASSNEEQLPIYELPPPMSTDNLPHLTPIDPSILVSRGSYPIDAAHRNGYLHTGHVLYIMDAEGKILFLQRSSNVVTCPNTWSILGEHSTVGESAHETVVRGIEEELGFMPALNFDETKYSDTWTVELHPLSNVQQTFTVSIQNVTEYPLYYIRHYGPRNDNRIDRQLTYLWLVQFPIKHTEIYWQLDDEVANSKWLSLDEVGSWLSADARRGGGVVGARSNNTSVTGASSLDGVRDDGPDEGEFCHKTIRSLYEAGLEKML